MPFETDPIDLDVEISIENRDLNPGDTFSITVYLRNNGLFSALNAIVYDVLPSDIKT